VAIFNAIGAAVRATNSVDDLAQRHRLESDESAGRPFAIEIPDRQAIRLDVEFRMMMQWYRMQWIDVRDEMTAYAVRVDQFEDASLLAHLLLLSVHTEECRIAVDLPMEWLERNAKRAEDLVVELVLAEQELVNACEQQTGLSTLNDAVIVGAGHLHDLADTELCQSLWCHRLILGRIFDRACSDDDRLTRHQARDRTDCADGAGIREADRRVLEIRNVKLVITRLLDDAIIRSEEFRERHLVRTLDAAMPRLTD
jgi:hypothetical protein